MRSPEDILNDHITSLKKGQSLGVTSNSELEALIALSKNLRSIPKQHLPTPNKQRLYITKEVANHHIQKSLSWLRIASLTVAGSALAITIIGSYSIVNSLPGERLFTYKKSAESVRVKFTSDASRAALEIALAQKRLEEAQQILATTPSDPKTTAAALTELTEQTKTAVASTSAVTNKNDSSKNTELVNKLSNLTQSQLTLLSTLPQTEETKPIALEALNATRENSKAVDSIKKVIAAANEETLAQAPVTITGIITSLDKNTITLDKTTIIIITSKTIIKNTDGKTEGKLVTKARANVQGIKDSTGITAKEITVETINTPEKEVTKETTKKPESPSTTPPPPPPATDTHSTQATFIPEDPNPQFKP